MPPAARRPSLAVALAAFAAQSEAVLAWAKRCDDPGLSQPSPLPGWSVRDALGHLTIAIEALRDAPASRDRPLTLADYVVGYADAADEIAGQPQTLSGDPRARLAAAVAGVRNRVPWPASLVMWSDPLASADAVCTRVLELVVHGDDLGIGADRDALGLACRMLAGILAARHPGRAVELRIAPFAAVQVLEGTVHRRGNPTAVVSCEPLTWLRLATGRLTWAAAERSGELQASGERSDLSAYLPVLT